MDERIEAVQRMQEYIADHLDQDISLADLAKTAERCFVIGGGSVYRQMLGYCDAAYITKVHTTTESDTFFPNLDEMDEWYIAETLMSGEENGIAYEMLLYKRK